MEKSRGARSEDGMGMHDYTQRVAQPSLPVGAIVDDAAAPDAEPRGPEVFVFHHDALLFALPVALVDAIIDWRAPVEVPASLPVLAGLVQHEGRVVAVARSPSGATAASARRPTRIVVCATQHGLIGLPATSTIGVTSLALGTTLDGETAVDTVDGRAQLVSPEGVALLLIGAPGPSQGRPFR
jgi:chemotaxis signal transduction protein